MSGGYWLIDTIVEVTAELPAEMVPDVRLERATDDQIAELKRMHPHHFWGPDLPLSEGRENEHVVTERTERGYTSDSFPLPRERWRWFVLTYRGNGSAIHDFYKLCSIADPPFDFRGIVRTKGDYGTGEVMSWGGHAPSAQNFDIPTNPVPVISKDTVDDLRLACSQYKVAALQHADIARAIHMLYDLRRVPRTAGLYILGLFSVLELLLTHKPQDRENADSLSHQLSTKIPLLDRRLGKSIDYAAVKLMGSAERFWKTLYAYRSSIAHGEQIDFTKQLRSLTSHEVVCKFLDETCRNLLRHALIEPNLIQDLKAI